MSNPASLRRHLFVQDDTIHTYAILDGASVKALPDKLRNTGVKTHICLYRGQLDAALLAAAPHLVKLEADHPFTELLLQGWGQHQGIWLQTGATLLELRKHFRRFLMVRAPDNRPLYFRYYDPRVLRVFLPSCNPTELVGIFGPVRRYLLEEQNPQTLLDCTAPGGKLSIDRIDLSTPASQ